MNYIDLFAGGGGLSEGFIRAGFKPIAHVEMDEAACYTLRTRSAYHYLKENGLHGIYVSYLKGEISRQALYDCVPKESLESVLNYTIGAQSNFKLYKELDKLVGEKCIDIIIGGPPCQAYSIAGRARVQNKMEKDRRSYLYINYAKFLEKYNPKMFVFENVLGLKSAKNGNHLINKQGGHLKNMQNLFLKKGYKMKLFTVEANNFGVLQNRKRIIIVGWKDDLAFDIPDLENIKIIPDYKIKVLLSDLPVIQAGEGKNKFLNYITETNNYLEESYIRNGLEIVTQHVARQHTEQDKEIYRIVVEKWNTGKERLKYFDLPDRLKTHKNTNSFFDRFKVVAADEPYSQTVVAHIAKDGHYYIHPDIDQNRSITVREAARLQSFSDDYYFEGIKEGGSRTAAFKQIGNAVPPLMAFYIASLIYNSICQKS